MVLEIRVPDIGDFKDVPIIEVLVKPGDVVKVDQSLITLEFDKATMDVPSPVAGQVAEIVAKVGEKVSMGTLIARVDATPAKTDTAAPAAKTSGIAVTVPDIGDFKDVPIIEVLVKLGDVVKVDQSLITLESDKATMDLPSPVAGKVTDLIAKVGDKVSMGTLIARVADGAGAAEQRTTNPTPAKADTALPAAETTSQLDAPSARASGATLEPSPVLAAPPAQLPVFSVFISYRHEDSPDVAARIYERIRRRFRRDRVFFDIDTIQPGVDFVDYTCEKVSACNALVVVIGKDWNVKRLEEPKDFVRIEIETALKCNCRVIPVLVGGAAMPTEENLPDGLKLLARRHAVKIASYASFDSDIKKLLGALPANY